MLVFWLKESTEQATDQASDQATDQVSDQAVLEFCKEARSIQEIMDYFKMSHRTHFRKTVLSPLLERGLLALTIPDKPTSPKQKYKMTKN